MNDNTIWMYHKGSRKSFKKRYQGTYDLMRDRGFEMIDLEIPTDIAGKKNRSRGDEKKNHSMSLGVDEF